MTEIYVFVVCGSKEHIDTLHFSLIYLSKYSQKEIFVLTDSSRNEVGINWKNIIDVQTPNELDHHQASIYLKTGIFKFVPKGNLYCYLDTDILAITNNCDEIFKEFTAPISFATDHCAMSSFSAYAVNCSCLARNESDRIVFNEVFKKLDRNNQLNSFDQRLERAGIRKVYQNIENALLKKLTLALRYMISFKYFKLNKKYTLNKSTKEWSLSNGEVVKYELNYSKLEKATGIRLNKWKGTWLNSQNENIFDTRCNHLQQQIKETFDVDVVNSNFRHWNGGVFLFDDSSHKFLESWHFKTMSIFDLEKWKTRDQGTLIATVWEFCLQEHDVLHKKWNFIADYYNEDLFCDLERGIISDNAFQSTIEPNFIHVYHHWADSSWDVWKWIKQKM
ncbi:MAG: hypothetical protein ACJAV5_000176 [Vicingaceae bacterium]|jgi:hypothetical protein